MYQLLGPLSTSKENVLTSRCHVSQLFSQWAISTGEKSPKSYWGTFFYFHLKFWKVLMKPQLSIKEFIQNQSVKKKIFSPSLKVTRPSISYGHNLILSHIRRGSTLDRVKKSDSWSRISVKREQKTQFNFIDECFKDPTGGVLGRIIL